MAALNWPMRTSILVLACAVIGFLPPAAWFTFRYQQVKVSDAILYLICSLILYMFGFNAEDASRIVSQNVWLKCGCPV